MPSHFEDVDSFKVNRRGVPYYQKNILIMKFKKKNGSDVHRHGFRCFFTMEIREIKKIKTKTDSPLANGLQ